MKGISWLFMIALLIWAERPALAQTQPEGERITVGQALDAWVTITEDHVMPVAEVMPESKYSFTPTGGQFKGVRTFGEQLKHLAVNNDYAASVILGEKPPEGAKGERGPDSVQTKADILRYVKGSFEHLHRAVAAIDDANMPQPIPGASGTWQRSRVALVVDAVAHSFNHYGQLVEYLRMNGIVPPDSR